MMELAIIKTMMDKDFYGDHKGLRFPDKLFGKDIRKIKQTLDYAMQKYEKTLTSSSLEALFYANNLTMTTANKEVFRDLFKKLDREQPLSNEIATDVLSKLFQRVVGEEVANVGLDFVNGKLSTMEPLRKMIADYQDDFMPNLTVEWDDISMETLLKLSKTQAQWKFNIPSLARRVEGISGGHLIMVGARSNTGKTSFHASLIASPNGFASQGAKCIVLVNEESYDRVGHRYMTAATGMNEDQMLANPVLAHERYNKVLPNVFIKDVTGSTMDKVEGIIKGYRPDIVVLDIGDKFADKSSERSDIYLKDAAIHARNIAKQYNCAIIYMSQLSASAQNVVNVDMSMLEGSKTGKAAETDLMILISMNRVDNDTDEKDPERHLIIAKNKLKGGWHGRITVELDGDTARYSA
jgi:replicative DNA helicase